MVLHLSMDGFTYTDYDNDYNGYYLWIAKLPSNEGKKKQFIRGKHIRYYNDIKTSKSLELLF